jgi:hypothetical protein
MKFLSLFFVIMLCSATILSLTMVKALVSTSTGIASSGAINYDSLSKIPSLTPTPTPTPAVTPKPTPTLTPTPTPTSTPSANNLVPIPRAWSSSTIGGTASTSNSIGGVANVILDNGVLHNGNPSIRLDPIGSTPNYAREVDAPWLNIKPGDHIVFSCWIKTSASSYGDTNPYSGARIAIDFYANGYITAWQSLGQCVWDSSGNDIGAKTTYVNWNKDWTLIVMDFVIPATVPANGAFVGWGTQYSAGQMVVPTAIIPWMQVWSSTYGATDSGKAWFADATLYINP